jgi:hypothetical protein
MTSEDFQLVSTYNDFKTYEDWRGFAKLICNMWNTDYGMAKLHKNLLTLATGGWSENEEIDSALSCNKHFQHTWKLSKRGGYTEYELPTRKSFK